MAVTYRLAPGAATYPGATTYPGVVGAGVELKALIALSDPTGARGSWDWEYLESDRVRSFSISRGRESELTEISAGTATLVVDNRDRAFDPLHATSPYSPHIRPLTPFWLQAELDGVSYDLFKGFAESFQQTWEPPGFGDAECSIQLVDEFKILALDHLPTTNPPRDNYEALVMFDEPGSYWRFDNQIADLQTPAVVGKQLGAEADGGMMQVPGTPIVGDRGRFWTLIQGGGIGKILGTSETQDRDPEDVGGLSDFAIETWFKFSVMPAATRNLITGPGTTGPAPTWILSMNSSGQVAIGARNSGGTSTTVTSPPLLVNVWYHVVGSLSGGNLRLYVDGTEAAASAAHSGSFPEALETGTFFQVGDASLAGSETISFDEIAFYPRGLAADRVSAHYDAGIDRGFPSQLTGDRIGAVLDDSASSLCPRNISAGVRTMLPVYMHGQAPLDAIKEAVQAEAVDAFFYAAKDGTLVYLDGTGSRTVQATFDDDGTGLPYFDCVVDYSESFLFNEWNVTRDGGLTQAASDATSIARFFKRPNSLSNLLSTDGQALTVANAMLAKYKDPLTRITSIGLTTDIQEVAEAVFDLDLGDKVRVFRTPPGGGSRIDQQSYVQKITISGANDGRAWVMQLGVSPL